MFMRGRIRVPALLWGILIATHACSPFMLKSRFSGGPDRTAVRILIVKTRDNFTISSGAPLAVSSKNTQGAAPESGSTAIIFSPSRISAPLMVQPTDSPLLLNGLPYRGTMEIIGLNGTALVINVLHIHEYLVSVVPGEIPADWEEEALKAQAVAARTYTYYHLLAGRKNPQPYDLDATAQSQVYRGMNDEKPRTTEAVASTAGVVIVYDYQPIISYFHSTCGGRTTDDRYVWNQRDLPYLTGVRCGYCGESTKFLWEYILTLDEIREAVSKTYRAIGRIRNIAFRKKDDRVLEIVIHHNRGVTRISGNNFRLLFPPEKIRSLYFTSKQYNKGLILTGHGWGHGVGLCQWGARGMAQKGFTYREILKHYYSGVEIASVKDRYIASKLRQGGDYH
ncbi:MAG: hypothetical protein A2176_11625 [Spirochaetes bacterium RBG_13_51_14]|nr:MAG: hypothetical protein A2176_11625 [Spirochaetes bacterium RBG_13_51_14]